jgi:cytidylate kinase
MKTQEQGMGETANGRKGETTGVTHSPIPPFPHSSSSLIVTIDGPAGSGKSTMSKLLAARLGATFLDTGAMYRAVTWAALQDRVNLEDASQLTSVVDRHRFQFEVADGTMQVTVDGVDITSQIRDPALTASVRHAAACEPVRAKLVEMQRQFARRFERIVTEGRDQGTVVFPEAQVKFFLTADPAERARRRMAELEAAGQKTDFEQLRQAIESRDKSDENRSVGPLKPAPDAILVDTTQSTVEQSAERLFQLVEQRRGGQTEKPEEAKETPRIDRSNVGKSVAWYWVARSICKVFCMLFFRVRVYGRENVPLDGPVLLPGNHQSYLDPVFCGISEPRRPTYMARDTLFTFGPFGWLLRSINVIPLSRNKADIATMRAVLDRLKKGEAVCLYPEGTRTTDGRIAAFKPGFGLLCRRSQATIVPVLIEGAFECWPRTRKLFKIGSHIVIRFGSPLSPEQVQTMTNEELADRVTAILRSMQSETRQNLGKPPLDYT